MGEVPICNDCKHWREFIHYPTMGECVKNIGIVKDMESFCDEHEICTNEKLTTTETCLTCKAFHQLAKHGNLIYRGECRKNPPTGNEQWPEVISDAWCMKWSPNFEVWKA